MFKSKAPPIDLNLDWTRNLREKSFYRYGHLRSLGLGGELTAIAVDPLLSLLAVGTSSGLVHVYGQASFQFTIPVTLATSSRGSPGIKFLAFHPGHQRLVVVDTSDTLHTYSLAEISEFPNSVTHPPLPVKEGSYTLWGTITSIDQPLPSHTHMFVTLKDGHVLAWDLSRRMLGNWKIGNCWSEHEERMVRSGIPGKSKTAGGAMATCLAMNPRDINIMLIGYEGGVVAWDFRQNQVVKTFEMLLPPGAPGGGTYQNTDSLWTERTPTVTCITWRPDGLVFAVGHSDGCISFWAYSESDKPLMVRTITHEDVNIADAESLLDAGALDTQIRPKAESVEHSTHEIEGMPVLADQDGIPIKPAVFANREPVYKLAWASFPDAAALKLLIAAQGVDVNAQPITNATVDYAERGETILLVLGGQSPEERPGVSMLQFPQYLPPLAAPKKPATPNVVSESMPVQERYAFRDSLYATGVSNYPTRTPPDDFVLLPRSSPHYGMAYDAVALIVTLTADDKLAKSPEPRGDKGMEAFVFPPARSSMPPNPLGRKTWTLPGEGENVIAMTPAPKLASRPSTPGSAGSGWKLPWTSGSGSGSPQPSPGLRIATPNSIMSAAGRHQPRARRHYRIPSSIWTGHLTVLGCELVSLPTPTFKRLISWSIEASETMPRVPLRGGLAVPDLISHNAPDVKVVKMEAYRLLVTFHPDATIRFWDCSPHLLVLPTPLRFEYPGPLPHLTISLGEYLKHPDIAHLPLARLWEKDRSQVRIKSVHLAKEALECVITMYTGEIIVTKFREATGAPAEDDVEELKMDETDQAGLTSPNGSYFPHNALRSAVQLPAAGRPSDNAWVEEVCEIGHLARSGADGFKPVAIMTLKRGAPVACAVSDIGFTAAAFDSKSLAIIDMRGPDVILREGFNEDGEALKRKKRKDRNTQNVVGEKDVVATMKWVICGMGSDPTPRPRLIVAYSKGLTKIYTMVNSLGEWMVESKPPPPTFANESLAGPIASYVLDATTGNELAATSEALQGALDGRRGDGAGANGKKDKDVPPHCVWIAASRRSIRAAVNVNGERFAKVELGEDEAFQEVFYITRHGHKLLVGITSTGGVMCFSVPHLQPVTRMELYFGSQGRKIGKISIDDRSGDFVEYSGPLEINLRTLFHFRKPLPPRIDPCSIKQVVPPQPAPLNATGYLASWVWGGAPLTGAQLDAIVAGPKRPPPPPAPAAPKRPLISWGDPPKEEKKDPAAARAAAAAAKRPAVRKASGPAQDRRERDDVYSEMRNAAEERGTYMDQLNDQLNAASVSASNYLQQARNQAMKEAGKATIKGAFGKLL